MKSDSQIKLKRVRDYLEKNAFSGMVLARHDTFSWITTGGSDQVILSQTEGAGAVVVTRDRVCMVAQVMDGQRIMDEEMSGLEAEYVPLYWYEDSPLRRAVRLAGENPVCDVPAAGAEFRLDDIFALQFPLTETEVSRLKTLGEMSDRILSDAARSIRPGMVDYEVGAMLQSEYEKRNAQCDVLLVGTDERIFRYKHAVPSGAKLGRYVLLHTAARLGGLHCNVTRSIYFGDRLPDDIAGAYEAVSEIEAHNMSRCVTGTRWSDIFSEHKDLLRRLGFAEDWRGHYPGGRTGYFVCQCGLSQDPENRILDGEAYDWFVTVTGAKVEELGLNADGAFSVLSQTGRWPSKTFRANGSSFALPQIMMR